MRRYIVAAVLLIATSNRLEPKAEVRGQAWDVDSSIPATLDSLRDVYRPLLVFAPTDSDQRFIRQARLLARGEFQLHERQVLFVPLNVTKEAKSVTKEAKSVTKEAKSWGVAFSGSDIAQFSDNEESRVRTLFHIRSADFTVILIGKDGGEKFRSHAPVTMERLNAVIDAMPMRQQEVRNGNSK